jgi:hypothetical protein
MTRSPRSPSRPEAAARGDRLLNSSNHDHGQRVPWPLFGAFAGTRYPNVSAAPATRELVAWEDTRRACRPSPHRGPSAAGRSRHRAASGMWVRCSVPWCRATKPARSVRRPRPAPRYAKRAQSAPVTTVRLRDWRQSDDRPTTLRAVVRHAVVATQPGRDATPGSGDAATAGPCLRASRIAMTPAATAVRHAQASPARVARSPTWSAIAPIG